MHRQARKNKVQTETEAAESLRSLRREILALVKTLSKRLPKCFKQEKWEEILMTEPYHKFDETAVLILAP